MVEYIEQDGHEKAEEIDVLSEEEYYMERQSYLDQRVEAVKKYYDTLEDKFQQKIVLDISKIKNQAYRDILTARNAVIEEVISTVRSRLTQLTQEHNICLYKKVLLQLIIQGLTKMMEPNVFIEVRKQDLNITQKVIKQAQGVFLEKTGMKVKLFVSESDFLPEKCNGGVIMHTQCRSMSLNNTIDAKIDLVASRLMPFIRKSLFGANPNRRHSD